MTALFPSSVSSLEKTNPLIDTNVSKPSTSIFAILINSGKENDCPKELIAKEITRNKVIRYFIILQYSTYKKENNETVDGEFRNDALATFKIRGSY